MDEGAKEVLEDWPYNIKPEKFSHLVVPSEALVDEPVDTNDEGVDVAKDPVQRAATVESVSSGGLKALAAVKGERFKGGDR